MNAQIIKIKYFPPPAQYSGELGASASRRVEITGTATISVPGLEGVDGIKKALRQRLADSGWQIHDFDMQATTGGWRSSYDVGIKILADVPEDYTNTQHRDHAVSVFSQYQLSILVATWHPFSNINLGITGQDKVNYVAPKTTTIKGTPTPKPDASNGGKDDGGAEIPNWLTTGQLPSITDLFGTAGLSVGLVAAVLVGIIILKR